MANLVYNSIRQAYEAELDNGDILSVDGDVMSEAIKERINDKYGKAGLMVWGRWHDRWPDTQSRPHYAEAEAAMSQTDMWNVDMNGVALIHPDGTIEWDNGSRRIIEAY